MNSHLPSTLTQERLDEMMASQGILFNHKKEKKPQSTARQESELNSIMAEIQMRMRRSVDDVLFIGRQLIYVKKNLLSRGEFEAWCTKGLGISRASRNRMMQAYQRFGQMGQLDRFDVSSIYLLAAPSTPKSAIEEVLSRKDRRLSVDQVKEVVLSHRHKSVRKVDRFSLVQRQIVQMNDEEFSDFLMQFDLDFLENEPETSGTLSRNHWETLRLKPGALPAEIEARAEALGRRYDPKIMVKIRETITRARCDLLEQFGDTECGMSSQEI